LVGLAGVPVFANFNGGFVYILNPTFGFIISFIIVAYISGKLIEWKQTKTMYMTASLIGMLCIYILGTNWMYIAYIFWFESPGDFSYALAWIWMSVPLPKDIVLAIVAGLFAFRLESILYIQKHFRTEST